MTRNPIARAMLWVPAKLFLFATRVRAASYQRGWRPIVRVKTRVASVGNLVLGGAGKTPFTMFLAGRLGEKGFRVGIVARGYKARLKNRITLVTDGQNVLASLDEAGDEAWLMAQRLKQVPIVVAKHKAEGAQWIENHFDLDWILIDDGFQHLQLARDRNILMWNVGSVDADVEPFPLGHAREPIEAIQRADAVICVGRVDEEEACRRWKERLSRWAPRARFFRAAHEHNRVWEVQSQQNSAREALRKKRLLAFCGIARPKSFLETLKAAEVCVADSQFFRDHHRYQENDLVALLARAQRCGADALITTAKDVANFTGVRLPDIPIYVVEVACRLHREDEAPFFDYFLSPSA